MSHDLRRDKNAVISDTTVDEALNVIGGEQFILGGDVDQVAMCIATSGGTAIALDQFVIEGQVTGGGAWTLLKDTFTAGAVDAFMVLVTVKLDTLAHGTSGFAYIHTGGLWAIRFKSAQAGVTAVAVTRTLEIGTEKNR